MLKNVFDTQMSAGDGIRPNNAAVVTPSTPHTILAPTPYHTQIVRPVPLHLNNPAASGAMRLPAGLRAGFSPAIVAAYHP
jgi:hypothetical protein